MAVTQNMHTVIAENKLFCKEVMCNDAIWKVMQFKLHSKLKLIYHIHLFVIFQMHSF